MRDLARLRVRYTLTELLELMGEVPARRESVRRQLKRAGVFRATERVKGYVYLSDLRRALPDLWDSICDCIEARRSVG